jgi:hypothetical protein
MARKEEDEESRHRPVSDSQKLKGKELGNLTISVACKSLTRNVKWVGERPCLQAVPMALTRMQTFTSKAGSTGMNRLG